MALLATSQITIVDLNDAVSLQSYLTGNVPKVQFVTNNGMYTPDYTNSPATITAELYRLGSSDNLITNNSRYVTKIEWFYKISPAVEWAKIETNDARFTLGGTSPKFHSVSINQNLMTSENPGIAIKCEMTYKEDWMPEAHIQKSEMDFSLTVQGDDGTDAYTALLTNANHTIICSSEGAPEPGELGEDGRAQSDVLVYKGSKLLTAVANTVQPRAGQFHYKILSSTGCSATRKDNDTFYISNLTTKKRSTGNNGASVTIEINCEGIQTLRQEMTITKVFHGADGTDGASAQYVIINGESAFKYGPNYSGTPTPSSITLTRQLFNVSGGKWQHYNGTAWTDFNPAQTGATITIAHNMANTLFANISNKQMRVRYYVNDKIFDEMTLVKLADGANGSNGADAYTVTLTNESHTVVCENNGTPSTGELAKAFTDVVVYKGTNAVTNFTIAAGTGADAPSGCTLTIDNTAKRVTVASLTADSAKATLVITVDGKTFKKVFTITKSKKALNGTSAKVLSISGPMAFSYTDGASTPTVSQITLTATCTNFTGSSTNIIWTNAKTGAELGKGLTLNIVHTNTGFVNNVLEVKAHYSGDTKVFDTHTIIKVFDGKSTVSGYIWGPQGNIIKNGEMSTLPLEAVVFNGSSNVTSSATFRWVKVSSSEGEVNLPNNTSSTITINASDIPNLLVVKCYMTYSGTTIQDTIVLEDRMDPIQATVFSTAGDTFKNGTGETHLVARIIRNGEEIDSISVVQSKPSSGGTGEIIYLSTDNKYYKWSGSAWTEIDIPEAGVNAHSKFRYTWYKYNEIGVQVSGWSRNGKIIRVQSSEVTQKASFVVEVED